MIKVVTLQQTFRQIESRDGYNAPLRLVILKIDKSMKRTAIVDRIRDVAHKMSPRVETILYGSEARGEARPDSDIDLLLLVDSDKLCYNDKDRIIAPFYDIELDTGIIISTMIMSRKEWEDRPFLTPFQYNVKKEGITL